MYLGNHDPVQELPFYQTSAQPLYKRIARVFKAGWDRIGYDKHADTYEGEKASYLMYCM